MPRTADRLLSMTLLALLFFPIPALAAVTPPWARGIAGKIRVTLNRKESDVLRDAAFLRRYIRPGQEVVILSFHSGLLHLLTQTTNPLDIPGDSELVDRRDYGKQYDYVMQRRGMSVIDKNLGEPAWPFIADLRRRYPGFHENPDGTMIVFPAR